MERLRKAPKQMQRANIADDESDPWGDFGKVTDDPVPEPKKEQKHQRKVEDQFIWEIFSLAKNFYLRVL